MFKKIKKACIIALFIAVCYCGGFAIGKAIVHFMKPLAQKGYVGPAKPVGTDGTADFTPEDLLKLGRLSDPQMSPDGSRILYGVSYTDIAENRSVRNLYILEIESGKTVPITMDKTSISCARWISDTRIAFLQGGQLYTAPLKRKGLGRRTLISNVPAGISEFTISPDGKKIIYTSEIDGWTKTPGQIYPDLPKADAYATDDLMYRHWDHYTTTLPHSFVAKFEPLSKKAVITPENSTDILSGEAFELPAEPFSGIEQLCWDPSSRYVAYSCRRLKGKEYAFSTNTDIFVFDTDSLTTEQITFGGGYDTNPVWSPDGKSLAWLSMARDGYEADQVRLMCIPMDPETGKAAGEARNLTAALDRNADGPMWAEDSGSIWFNCLTDGLQAIYRVSLDGTLDRVTDNNDWHDYTTPFHVAADGTIYASWQSLEFPTELVAIKNGVTTQITHENDALLAAFKPVSVERRMVTTTDGKQMLTWVMLPPDFNETNTYPAIEILLGGPQGTISQGWSYRWCYRLMAGKGYIVVLPNRRGTTAFGQEWCEQISGDYCGQNMQDYLSAAAMIKSEPWCGKLAACGASYGGYSVYYLAGVHKDVYDCFIAHAGIFNEEHMYYTTEEMWFPEWDNGGSPWSESPVAKRHYANSPHKLVQNWHTPILCIHGGKDYRVPLDEGMAAFNCAQMMGVPSRFVIFPGENHWILKPQNALYWHREYFGWLDKWCK